MSIQLNQSVDDNVTYLLMSCGFRSGAALLSSIINAHSDVNFSIDVIKYWNSCGRRYENLDKYSLREMLGELKFRISTRYSVDMDMEECINKVDGNYEHVHIYKIIIEHIVRKNSKGKIFGECEGLIWTEIPQLLKNIPNSKAMIVVRDPRDVLVSFKKNTIAKGYDYLVSVFNSKSLMDSYLKYEKKYGDRFLGIRYEELKSDMEKVTKNITQFLGINFENSMLYSENWNRLGDSGWVKWENHGSSSFENKNNKMNPVGRWRDLIDPVDHFICEWIVGSAMRKFGIESEIDKPTPEIFNEAINRLMSSDLLRQCFFDFSCNNKGSEKYPLEPFNPVNWDKRYIDHPEKL